MKKNQFRGYLEKNDNGFTLVEVMIAMGMIGAISLSLIQMQKNATKTRVDFEKKLEVSTIQNEIQQILASPENCINTFGGKNAVNANNTVNAIKFKNNTGAFVDKYKNVVLDPNVQYGSGKIKIEDFSLSDAANDVDVAIDKTTHLLIRFYTGKLAGVTATRNITLKVNVDASNNILSCVSLSNASEIWTRSTINSSNIFYSGGSVGIGTNNPSVTLEVNGVTKSNEIQFSPVAALGGVPCTAGEEGKQRYNSTIKNMEFCDGIIWRIVGFALVSNWINGPGDGSPLRADVPSALALCRANGYNYFLGGNFKWSVGGVSWSCTRSIDGLTLISQGFGACGIPAGTLVWRQVLCGK